MKKKIVGENGYIRVKDACSSPNGISFIVSKKAGDYSKIVTDSCYTTIEGSKIGNAVEDYFLLKQDYKWKNIWRVIMTILFILSIAPVYCIPDRGYDIGIGVMLIGMGIIHIKGMLCTYIMDKLKYEAFKKVRRFHGAEHAVINAYYDLHRVPTIEEIKRYSNWSYHCGSLSSIESAMPFFIIGICRIITSTIYSFIFFSVIGIIIGIFLIKNKKICFLEFLVTSNPTDEEYTVAIKGLQCTLNNLEKIEIDDTWIRESEQQIKDVLDIINKFM